MVSKPHHVIFSYFRKNKQYIYFMYKCKGGKYMGNTYDDDDTYDIEVMEYDPSYTDDSFFIIDSN